ncbi:MAG: methylated-DNA--[protein]-cysteine S-methyltransferase [Candidatus Obscuribacterales bacterium]|nr:methylated-DNA--[protein]-cysteine S-methyltransferase [Candidatus Obscuribacterales bacterium]
MSYRHYYESPLGRLLLLASNTGALKGIYFENHKHISRLTEEEIKEASPSAEKLADVALCLDQYFEAGRFARMPELELQGTQFQLEVWHRLMTIAPATTTTYGDIAIDLGRESAQRAVGAAVGKNPVSILIPCHRVIGKNQKLTGFAGGLCNKEWLLRHELNLLAGHIDKTGQRVEAAVTNNG